MDDELATMLTALNAAMAQAAAALDFEEARRLRDRIALLRTGASPDGVDDADTALLDRQQPGAMGLGTSQSRPEPPTNWIRPVKPDPMTRGRNRR